MAEPRECYRIIVTHDPERGLYVARSPELSPCLGEGATRAEATQRLEEDMAALLANLREQGREAPMALDSAGAGAGLAGPLTVKLSSALHRELLWQAKVDGVEVDQLVEGLLAVALDGRRRGLGPVRPRAGAGAGAGAGNDRGGEAEPGNRRADPPGPGPRYGVGRGGPSSARYHDIMEDRASFVEYVRQLESGGGRGPGGGQGGGRGPGPGGGGRGPGGRGPGGGGRGPGGGGRGPGGGPGGGGRGPGGGGGGPGGGGGQVGG